jgi:hypothetical protein
MGAAQEDLSCDHDADEYQMVQGVHQRLAAMYQHCQVCRQVLFHPAKIWKDVQLLTFTMSRRIDCTARAPCVGHGSLNLALWVHPDAKGI